MPDPLIDVVLEAWRQGEELLPTLKPQSPDHESVLLAVNELRTAYITLVDRSERSNGHGPGTEQAIQRSRSAIRSVAARNPGPDAK